MITAEKTNTYATVTGAGSKTVNVSDTAFAVTVTAESGVTKTYTVNIKRLNGDATLKSATLNSVSSSVFRSTVNEENIVEIPFPFDPTVPVHTVNVEDAVRNIMQTVEPADSFATVTGTHTGIKALATGENIFYRYGYRRRHGI